MLNEMLPVVPGKWPESYTHISFQQKASNIEVQKRSHRDVSCEVLKWLPSSDVLIVPLVAHLWCLYHFGHELGIKKPETPKACCSHRKHSQQENWKMALNKGVWEHGTFVLLALTLREWWATVERGHASQNRSSVSSPVSGYLHSLHHTTLSLPH